ncbi:MAG: flagellar biosynthetic protein FliR [Planctomycetaceae bacterium]|nr:flagellar biosynthetic protein FliR [Planctomycetaceae bacterium]
MITKLLGFMLVLTRVSAFFVVAPIFSAEIVPARIRICIVVLISIFFASVSPPPMDFGGVTELQAILLLINESIYGFALGLISVLIYSAVKVAGQHIEREMGLTMGEIFDPISGESGESLGLVIDMLFILMFLNANGHHMLLMIISKSYQAFPVGTFVSIPDLVEGVVKAGSVMLTASLRLAAPMLAAFLLLLIVLAVFSRLMPDMDILFISMPLRVGLGLLMLGTFLPFINQFVSEFADWMGKLLPL